MEEYSKTTIHALKMHGRIIIGAEARLTNYYGAVLKNDHCKIVSIGTSGTVYVVWTGRRNLCENIIDHTNITCNMYNLTDINDIAAVMVNVVNQTAGVGDSLGSLLGGYFPFNNSKLFQIEKLDRQAFCSLMEGNCFIMGSGSDQVQQQAPSDLYFLSQVPREFVENHVFEQIRLAVQFDWGSGDHIYSVLMADNGYVNRAFHQCLNPNMVNSNYAAPRAW